MKSQHLGLAAVLAIGVAAPVTAQDRHQKIDRALQRALAAGCSHETVIIRATDGFRGGVAKVLEEHGDKVATEHTLINAVTADVHCDDLKTLAGFREVVSISKDAQVRTSAYRGSASPATIFTRQDTARTNGHSTIGRPRKTKDETSPVRPNGDPQTVTPVAVAIIDSGIQPSPEFGNRITHFYDFTAGRARKVTPTDGYGHGTHIAGLIAGRTLGRAPTAHLVGLKVLNSQGEGRTSDVVRAIEFATVNRHALGIRAINLSLGHPVYEPAASDPLVQAVEQAVRAGLVVITASGNIGINPETGQPGYAGIMSPGNAPSGLTVGAIQTFNTMSRADDRVAPYSSRGPSWYDGFAKPDLVAPGHRVWSVAARHSELRKTFESEAGYGEFNIYGEYLCLSGTSMAAGHTSGVVAAMLQANPELTPNALKMVLQFTSIPVNQASGEPFDALAQGAGALNMDGAVRLARAIDAQAPVGAKWLTVGMPFESVIGMQTVAWSQSIVWGPHRVRGDGLVDENRPAWATGVVWGDGIADDNIDWGLDYDVTGNAIWGNARDLGDNIVWGTNFVWGRSMSDNIVWGTSFADYSIVWGTNIVWGSSRIGIDTGFNIVWGTMRDSFNIVWGTLAFDNIVWGTLFDRNIVWGTLSKIDYNFNIVWGTSVLQGDGPVDGTNQSTAGYRKR